MRVRGHLFLIKGRTNPHVRPEQRSTERIQVFHPPPVKPFSSLFSGMISGLAPRAGALRFALSKGPFVLLCLRSSSFRPQRGATGPAEPPRVTLSVAALVGEEAEEPPGSEFLPLCCRLCCLYGRKRFCSNRLNETLRLSGISEQQPSRRVQRTTLFVTLGPGGR